MIRDLGVVQPGTTLYIPFHTFDSNDPSASVTLTGLATTDIEIYKDGSTTQRASDSGYALLDTDGIDFDATTGIHGISIDLADNTTAGFYAAGSQYWVVIASVTVDAATINFVLCTFRIGYLGARLNTTIATLSSQTSFTLTVGPAEDDALNGCYCLIHDVASAVQVGHAIISDYTGSTKTVTLAAGTTFTAAATDNIAVMGPAPLQPTVAARTLDVSAGGEAGVDWANVGTPGSTVSLSATTVATVTTTTTATNVTTVNGLAANVITAASIAADAIGASELAADAVAEIADAVWDEDATAHQTQGTFGQAIGDPVADTNTIYKATVTDATGATVGADSATLLSRLGTPSDLGGGATVAANLSDIEGQTDDIGVAGAGLTAIPWNAAWDAEVQSEVDDALVAQNLDHLVKIAVDTNFATTVHLDSVIGHLADAGTTATFDRTTDALEVIGQTTADTLVDTAEIGAAGAGLTNINLPNQTMDIVGNITGNLSGSVGSVTGAVGSVTGAVGSVTGLTPATVHSDLDDIQARLPAALTGAGNMKADTLAINGNTTSAAVLAILNGATVVYQGTVTGAATTTTLIDSGLTQADTDWWKGRIIIFTSVITMQATDITAFDPATDKLTFTAVTSAPTAATYVII